MFWSKDKKSKKLLKAFYATDIHGSEVAFRKFVNAGRVYEVEALILGGDITGKFLIPIMSEGNGTYSYTLQGLHRKANSEDELQELIKRIELLGFYHVILSPEQMAEIEARPGMVQEIFRQKSRERLERWVALAEERLGGTGIRCFVTGGNDDEPEVIEVLETSAKEAVVPCDSKATYLDDSHLMISCGYSNPTPWQTPREMPDEELAVHIEEMLNGIADFTNCIFNFHAPPLDSTLDECPKLDTSTDPPRPIMVGNQPVMYGAGSKSVKEAIEKYQPLACLVGHIHEARGTAKIGRTMVFNPGSEYGEGIVRGTILTFGDGEIKGYQMTSG